LLYIYVYIHIKRERERARAREREREREREDLGSDHEALPMLHLQRHLQGSAITNRKKNLDRWNTIITHTLHDLPPPPAAHKIWGSTR
jgi:hypothetical protein